MVFDLRNYQDAKNIEEIFRELLRYALPKLEKNILTEKISEILDNFKDASNEVILKVADALGVKHLLEKELKVGDTGDTSQKATNEDLNYFETLMEIIDPALNVTVMYLVDSLMVLQEEVNFTNNI